MPNLDLLDNIIALVVVILLLSLIVQSLQGLLKKVLSLKSKEIEASLLDLFSSVLREERPADGRKTTRMPRVFAPVRECSGKAQVLFDAVKKELQELGRVNPGGRFLVDSLSKVDLLNVIARVAPDAVATGLTGRLATAMQKVKDIQKAIGDVKSEDLPGEANALFAKLQEALAPLQVHYRRLIQAPSSEAAAVALRPDLVVADVLTLREVVFTDTLDLLGRAQQVLAANPAAPGASDAQQSLAKVATAINAARQSLDDAIGGFKAKLGEVESWFDTVMQGFEERYHRGMRTYSIILGAVVVVLLNANVFTIYKSISVSEALREKLAASSQTILDRQQELAKLEDDLPATREQVVAKKKELDGLVNQYTSFGFQPVTWKQFCGWLSDVFTRSAGWGERRADDFRTLLGWVIMTMLLSFGAPFWHDALESLFGVKNLLRKRNEQRNVEQARGAGNPAT